MASDSHMNERILYSMCCRKISGYPAGDIMCVICIFGFEKDRLYNYINDKIWQRKYISTDRYISANIKSEGSIKESVIVTKV